MEDNNVIELVYHPAKKWKRIVSGLIDFVLAILFALTFFSIFDMSTRNLSYRKEISNKREEVQLKSGLYSEANVTIYEYTENDSLAFPTYRDKKDFLAKRIDAFYASVNSDSNQAIIQYNQRRLSAKYENTSLFALDSELKVVEMDVNPSYLYDFYVDEIKNHAMSYLYEDVDYINATRLAMVNIIVEVAVGLLFGLAFFYLFFPLVIFKRGRQTLGRKLLKIGLISSNALNVKKSKYLLRFLFIVFVYYLLDFFGFLIPLMVSLAMMFLSKRQESLPDYLLSQYMVDVTYDTVYLDYADYLEAKKAKEQAVLENRDFKLHE